VLVVGSSPPAFQSSQKTAAQYHRSSVPLFGHSSTKPLLFFLAIKAPAFFPAERSVRLLAPRTLSRARWVFNHSSPSSRRYVPHDVLFYCSPRRVEIVPGGFIRFRYAVLLHRSNARSFCRLPRRALLCIILFEGGELHLSPDVLRFAGGISLIPSRL